MPAVSQLGANAVARKRRAFVYAFYRYLAEDNTRALEVKSIGQLADLLRSGGYYQGSGVDKPWASSTARQHFAGRGTHKELWAELCAHTTEYFGTQIPEQVQVFINDHWASVGPQRRPPATGYDLTEFDDWTDDDLSGNLRDGAKDINEALAAARVYADRHVDILHRSRDDIQPLIDAALTLIDIGETALRRVEDHVAAIADRTPETTSPLLTATAIRHYCIPIFDATADAYRILSRDPTHEVQLLEKLNTFRDRHRLHTDTHRPPVGRIMIDFYTKANAALLTDGMVPTVGTPRSTAQIAAISDAINELDHCSAGDLDDLDDETVRILAIRLASFGLAYPHHRAPLSELAATLLHLFSSYPQTDTTTSPATRLARRHLRHEVSVLLKQAHLRESEPDTFLRPPQMLGLTRYNGVGSIMLADALLRIADHPHPGHAIVLRKARRAADRTDIPTAIDAHQDLLEPFLGPWSHAPADRNAPEDPETAAQRNPHRNIMRRSARAHYNDAAGWFRQLGAPGVLRAYAAEKRDELDRAGYGPGELLEGITEKTLDGRDLVTPIDDLAHRVDIVIAHSITDFSGAHVKTVARWRTPLVQTLSHAVLVVQDPTAASLASDLAPINLAAHPAPSHHLFRDM